MGETSRGTFIHLFHRPVACITKYSLDFNLVLLHVKFESQARIIFLLLFFLSHYILHITKDIIFTGFRKCAMNTKNTFDIRIDVTGRTWCVGAPH
jgi:hypothetical protein